MNFKIHKVLGAIVSLIAISGCVTPPTLNDQGPSVAYASGEKIAISVNDQRESLKEGKPENYVGYSRTSLGIPISHTLQRLGSVEGDKNRTLAQYIAHRMQAGLTNSGWDVVVVDWADSDSETDVETGSKALLMRLIEWDMILGKGIFETAILNSEVIVKVIDQDGSLLIEKKFANSRTLQLAKTGDSRQTGMIKLFKDELELILEDSELVAVIQ